VKVFGVYKKVLNEITPFSVVFLLVMLMEHILHQLYNIICKISHHLQGFVYPRWLFGISSIHSRKDFQLGSTARKPDERLRKLEKGRRNRNLVLTLLETNILLMDKILHHLGWLKPYK